MIASIKNKSSEIIAFGPIFEDNSIQFTSPSFSVYWPRVLLVLDLKIQIMDISHSHLLCILTSERVLCTMPFADQNHVKSCFSIKKMISTS